MGAVSKREDIQTKQAYEDQVQPPKLFVSSDESSSDEADGNYSKSTEALVNDATLRNLASDGGDTSTTRDFVSQIINDERIQQFAFLKTGGVLLTAINGSFVLVQVN